MKVLGDGKSGMHGAEIVPDILQCALNKSAD